MERIAAVLPKTLIRLSHGGEYGGTRPVRTMGRLGKPGRLCPALGSLPRIPPRVRKRGRRWRPGHPPPGHEMESKATPDGADRRHPPPGFRNPCESEARQCADLVRRRQPEPR